MGLLDRRRANDPAQADAPSDGMLSAKQVKDLYEKGYKAIRKATYDYWLNSAFLEGQQWLFWNPETRRLDDIPRDPDRVQATINKLLPASRTIVSKATSRQLQFDVPPTQADDATVRAARLSEAVLRDLHREHDWEAKREEAVWETWRGAAAVVAVDWDPSAGTDLDMTTDNGKRVGTGDTVETVLSIAEFVVEPGVKDAERARWWTKARALPPEEVQATFKLAEKPAADATAGMSPQQQRLLSARGTRDGETPDLTLVLTYYERPNHLRPKGMVCSVVGDKIVDGPNPWPFPFTEHLNFAIQRETRGGNTWIGDTVLNAARPVQTAFNASWSAIIEHMKLAGNARLAVPQSAVDMISVLTDEPGELIPYPDGVDRPAWLSPPQMPAWWIEQPDKLAAEMDDILGVHAVSRGEAPANIQSGFGLSILSENDSTPLGRLVKESAQTWGKVASMVLRIYAAKVTDTRTAKVMSAGAAPETAQWSGKDLMGQTTAEVPVDAVMPRSRAAMQAFAEKAMQMGLINSVQAFARVAELPGQNDLIEAAVPDVAKARRENYSMALGKPEVPEDFDDHAHHIHEHNDFRKSARFSQLDPEIQKMIGLHIQGHATLAAEAMGNQAGKGMVSPALASVPNPQGAPTIDTSAIPAPGQPMPGSPAEAAAMPPPEPDMSMPMSQPQGAPPA